MIGSVSLQVAPVFRLPVAYAAVLVLLFVAMTVIHFARRAYRQPTKEVAAPVSTEPTEGTVKAFDIVERVYHWTLFIVTGLMVLTGISLFAPGVFDALLSAFGVTSTAGLLLWHTDMVWALLGILVIHIVWDVAVRRGWKNIWFGVKDIRDSTVRARNFFGMSRKYSKPGKYDIFMKTLHWGFALSIVVLGVTGVFMMNPYGLFYAVSPGVDNLFRILHDIFAFLFIGMVVGHVYFAVIPVNWPVLKAIFTGNITQEAYIKEYDTERWALKHEKPKAPEKPKEAAPVPIAKAIDVNTTVQVDQSTKKLVGE